ncbi:hypothetical protein Dimus_034741 [Dionaea muscipula]
MGARHLFLLVVTVALAGIVSGAEGYTRPPPRQTLSIARAAATSPEQVHVSVVGENNMRISWITQTYVPSTVYYGTSSRVYGSSATGSSSSYRYLLYHSGDIHDVVIGPLQPNTTYYYTCGTNSSTEFTLKTPPAQFPLNFAIAGIYFSIRYQSKQLYMIGAHQSPI